jgi:hypothetical protein
MSKDCLESTLDNTLSICFLYENWMVRFFQRTPRSIFLSNLVPISFLSYFNSLLKPCFIFIFSGALCWIMMKKGGSRQDTMSLSSINGEGSREPPVGKICLEVT